MSLSTATTPTTRLPRPPCSVCFPNKAWIWSTEPVLTDTAAAYRRGHRLGNRVLTGIVQGIFGNRVTDMLSGYRVFSRRVVKSFPALSVGFETETELTIHALELKMPVGEIPTPYKDRPAGSASKLRTYSDGLRILRTIVLLVKEERPLQFFAVCALVLAVLSVALAVPVVGTYLRTGLVPRLPTAVLATGLMLLAFLSMACGLILDTVTRGRKEMKPAWPTWRFPLNLTER